MEAFIASLDPKLRRKLIWQFFRLSQTEFCDLKEPHYKHFVLERYSQFYEMREKNKILVRIIFAIDEANGDNAVGDAYNIVPVILIIGAAISALALLKVKK